MRVSGASTTNDEQVDDNLDVNSASVSSVMDLGRSSVIGVYVVGDSGSHDSHILTVQATPDGDNWFDTEYTITGIGSIQNAVCVAEKIRVKVTTLEGADSTINLTVMIR